MTNATSRWLQTLLPIDRPDEVREAVTAVVGITRLLRDQREEARMFRVVCMACGCLCRPDEVCPGCRSIAITRARQDAQAEWRAS